MPDEKYTQQIIKAKETLGILENELHQIRLKLRNSPTDSEYLKELKRITLGMTIALNDLEHSQSTLDEYRDEHRKMEERYND